MLITPIDVEKLLKYVESTPTPLANITFFQTIVGVQSAPTIAADALRGPSQFPGFFFFFWTNKFGPFLDLCVSSLYRVILIFSVLFQLY